MKPLKLKKKGGKKKSKKIGNTTQEEEEKKKRDIEKIILDINEEASNATKIAMADKGRDYIFGRKINAQIDDVLGKIAKKVRGGGGRGRDSSLTFLLTREQIGFMINFLEADGIKMSA